MEQAYDFALEFRLRALDPALHRRFTDGVFGLQKILSNYKLIFPAFTDHTELHSITVIDFCSRLIGGQLERMNADEIYALLMGCYFHDTGMGVSRKDYEAFSRQIDMGDYREKHPDAPAAEVIRTFHNEFSGLFIRKYADFFELPSEAHLRAVIQIARGHRKTDLTNEAVYPRALPVPGDRTICLPYLAALVRLADEIDVTSARNSPLLYDVGTMTDEINRFEHLRHRAVHSLEIAPEAFILRIDDSDPAITGSIRSMTEKMQTTLDDCRAAVNGRTGFELTQREVRVLPDRQGRTERAAE